MTRNPLADLAALVSRLDELGRLARIKSAVDLRYDLAGIGERLADAPRALLFENPKGHAGPVLTGLYRHRAVVAAAAGQEERSLSAWLGRRCEHEAGFEPVTIADGPVREVTESAVDLGSLPIPVHALEDAGPAINAAVLIAKDPATGLRVAAMPRLDVSGRDTLNMALEPGGQVDSFLAHARRLDRSLWITINCGVGPALQLAAMARGAPVEGDDLAVAGAVAGEPLELVPGRESDCELVARANWALECEIIPEEASGAAVTAHVRRVHRRNQPVFATLLPGEEQRTLAGLAAEARVSALLRRQAPGFRDLAVTANHAVVAIAREHRNFAKQMIVAGFAAQPTLRLVTVVEEGVDIRDPGEVARAVAERCDPRSGLVRIEDGSAVKIGFDAAAGRAAPHPAFKDVATAGLEFAARSEPPPPPTAATAKSAPQAEPPPPREAAAARDFDAERISRREIEEWRKSRAERPAAAARPAAGAASPQSGGDWDESRWWRREMDEMRKERDERARKPAKKAIAPRPAPATAPSKPVPPRPNKEEGGFFDS